MQQRSVKVAKMPNPHLFTEPVANPLWTAGNTDELRLVDAVHTMRDDPLARLYARRQIDKASFRAGRKMQELYEAVGVSGGLTGIDFTAPVVDRSFRARDGITDRKNQAALRIERVKRVIGEQGEKFIRAVLAERTFINQLASGKAETTFMGRVFRMHLGALAVEFGYRTG